MTCLEQSRWMPIAEKALNILEVLAPLHSDEFLQEKPEKREIKKAQVLKLVKTLAFPYQDAPYSRSGETPDLRANDSPLVRADRSPTSHPVPPSFVPMPWPLDTPDFPALLPTNDPHLHPIQRPHPPPPSMPHTVQPYAIEDPSFPMINHTHPHSVMTDIFGQPVVSPFEQIQPPADEGSMWGASVGFAMGEWQTFLSAMQPPDNTRSKDETDQ